MEWLAEWFVLWSLSFWILIGAEVIALVTCLYNDDDLNPWVAMFSILATLTILQFVGKIPIVQAIIANPKITICLALLYVMIGSLWMCVKWVFFIKSKVRKYKQEIRDEFVQKYNIKGSEIPAEYKDKLRDEMFCKVDIQPPQVSKFKDELFVWFALWPFSAIWTVINDPIKRLFECIYHNIHRKLQAVSNHFWKQIMADAGTNKDE